MNIYYWDVENKKEVTIDEIRSKHVNASIPDNCDLSGIGYWSIQETQAPNFDPVTSAVRYTIKEVSDLNGRYFLKEWEIFPLPDEVVYLNRAEHTRKIKEGIVKTAQENLDNFAQSGGYDSIISACTYVNSLVPKFADEANKCVQLRDAYWSKAYEILEDVLAGNRPVPESFDDIKDELPVLTWR